MFPQQTAKISSGSSHVPILTKDRQIQIQKFIVKNILGGAHVVALTPLIYIGGYLFVYMI